MAVTQNATVKVDFATTFDGRALAQANNQLGVFEKFIKRTGKQLVGLYSVSRVYRYSKAAVAGAFQESKAQAQLANQLKNVGLGYATITSEKWIQDFQKQTGILDDELRPAFSKLARVTQNLSQSQELMQMAFDVAAGAGIDYASAVDILSKAYVGNYRGLRQLNLGISQTKLQSMTAGEVFTLMSKKFDGAGQSMITSGDRLNVMFNTLKDSVGAAIIKGLADDSNIKSMNEMTQALNDMMPVVTFIAKGFKELAKFASVTVQLFDANSEAWRKTQGKWPKASIIPKSYYENLKKGASATADTVKNLKTVAKLSKDTTAEQAKQVALQKLSIVLSQAQKLFDPEAITLAAAAMGDLSAEDRARVKLKQDIYDLEKAINEQNVAAATKISATLVSDAQLFSSLRSGMESLKNIPDPFAMWAESLKAAVQELLKLQNMTMQLSGLAAFRYKVQTTPNYEQYASPWQFGGSGADVVTLSQPVKMAQGGIVTQATNAIVGEAGAEAIIPLSQMGSMTGSNTINVNVSGSVITQQQLVDAIALGLQNKGASGIPTTFSRVNSPYIA